MNIENIFVKNKKICVLLYALTVAVVVTTIVNGWINYSPVPYWDVWDGVLEFILRIKNGDNSAWWYQHNEHRLIISRIIFFADYEFFGANSCFLIILNYVLAFLSACMFWFFAKSLNNTKYISTQIFIVSMCWAFAWTQYQNFTWTFQGQFFLAYLLPLAAFYFLVKSSQATGNFYFLISCVIGALSAGTMANGVIVLPLIFLGSFFVDLNLGRKIILFFEALTVVFLYFYDYNHPAGHGSFSDLLYHPVLCLNYVITCLGNVFYYLSEPWFFSKNVAAFCGGVFLIVFLLFLYGVIKNRKKIEPYEIGLLLFVLYITGSVIGASGGRASNFGLDQALTSRYTTPVIMGWVALTLISVNRYIVVINSKKNIFAIPLIFLMILLLRYQIINLKFNSVDHFSKNIAALAVELGVKDDFYTKKIFPFTDYLNNISYSVKKYKLSVFGKYPYVGLDRGILEKFNGFSKKACFGSLDAIQPIKEDHDYVRIVGWMFSYGPHKVSPQLISFVNNENIIIGYALTGTPRSDVEKVVPGALYSGYVGYVLKNYANGVIYAYGDYPFCRIEVNVPSN